MIPDISVLLATLTGGLVTLAGTWLTQHFSAKREERQWRRDREAEAARWERERSATAEAELRALYSECLYRLAAVTAAHKHAERTGTPDESHEHLLLAQKALAELLTHVKAVDEYNYSQEVLEDFLGQPDPYQYARVFYIVVGLLQADQRLQKHQVQGSGP